MEFVPAGRNMGRKLSTMLYLRAVGTLYEDKLGTYGTFFLLFNLNATHILPLTGHKKNSG